MRDDSELLRLYAETKSDEAFAELVRRHIGSVYAVAMRRVGGDTHLAEEITQEVFTDLARKAAPLSRRETLVGWLFVAARFASAKAIRRARLHHSLSQKAQQMTEHAAHSDSEPAWEEIRPVLDDAIYELNERDREAILLYFFDKRTFGDLGAKLSITESGARMRVDRALDKLRRSLGRRGITSTSAALTVVLGNQAVAAVPGSLVTTVTAAAVAAAAQPAGIAVGYILLMNITKSQLGAVLVLVLIGAAIVGVEQSREISKLRTENTALLKESTRNTMRANELASKLHENDTALTAIKAQLADLETANGAAAAKAAVTNPQSDMIVIHMKDLLRDHPEYAALHRKELRRNVVRTYGRAISTLNLTPDQAAQLKELLVEKEMTTNDAIDAVTQAGLKLDSGEASKAISQATKDLDQAIKLLIGSDATEKMEALKGTSFFGSQNSVDDFALDMVDVGVALSADQAEALAQMLHDLSSPAKNPESASPDFRHVDHTTWQSPMDQQFFAKAALVLTPNQLQILKTSRSDNNQRNAVIDLYRSSKTSGVMITN